MKKALLIGVALMLFAGVANAGPNTYTAFYFDENRTDYCVYTPGPYTTVTAWLWVLPADHGVSAMEFAVDWAGNAYNTNTTQNDDVITLTMGAWFDGISVTGPCQYDWFWLVKFDFLLIDNTTPGHITLIPHKTYDTFIYTSCEEGNPIYDLTMLTGGYWNTDPCPEVGVEPTSWGAIKSMYSE